MLKCVIVFCFLARSTFKIHIYLRWHGLYPGAPVCFFFRLAPWCRVLVPFLNNSQQSLWGFLFIQAILRWKKVKLGQIDWFFVILMFFDRTNWNKGQHVLCFCLFINQGHAKVNSPSLYFVGWDISHTRSLAQRHILQLWFQAPEDTVWCHCGTACGSVSLFHTWELLTWHTLSLR